MNGLTSIFKGLISPVTSLISEFVEDKDKANEIEFKVKELVDQASGRAYALATKELDAKQAIIIAEANGSWIQRNWRPLMMIWFAFLLGLVFFGKTPEGMTEGTINNLFSLLELGIGGYVVGRSFEKVAPVVTQALKK